MSAVAAAWERVNEGICRRSFSSPEALLYEVMIAPASPEARDGPAPSQAFA